ncbi:Crp/Fnr family transcriptional regulator [Marinifilum fragile]|uniref:Crp/Fnr family transcriptional regulator n=1 Tax=Marinifilum fragile TaxID=570161 RepID=UPI002AAC49EA|nr:Crp/Fnr family transcriptional regulator [Marinifilum fragile]
MRNAISAIDRYYKLSKQSKNLIIHEFEEVRMKKGEVLIHESIRSPYLYFIEEGAVKNHYIDEKGNKKVVWFGFEGNICFSMNSYININYIHETTELLEDSLFYRVKINHVKALFKDHCDWANWGRCFMESVFINTIHELDEFKSLATKEKYMKLIENNQDVKERVPLKDIASYLGVSPVTISRLRKELGIQENKDF